MKMLIHAQTIDGATRPIRLSEPEIFCDREKEGRSGHVGHGLCEFAPGKIVDFIPNTSKTRFGGHSMYGYMEYRISEDWGRTFGEARVFPWSWECLMNGVSYAAVEKVARCPGGDVLAFCLMGGAERESCCEPYQKPMYARSRDGCETWEPAREFSPCPGRIFDTLTIGGSVYVLEGCGPEFDLECYRLFKSDDEGETFYETAPLPIGKGGCHYGALIENPDGSITVYLYQINRQDFMLCAVTRDGGESWEAPFESRVAKKIRNPQVMLLDGQYILHGRAGENEAGSGAFVFYTSADGRAWDEGTILVDGRPACFYSNNLVLTCPDGKQRALVEYSENYRDPVPGIWSGTCNEMHLWVESAT